jgi:hypothetical protein
MAFDLATVRWLLKGATYGALVSLVLAAGVTHRGLLGVSVAISVMAVLFWGLPYFGPSLSHAPGDALVILPLAWLLLARERMSRPRVLLPFCAAYGAGVTYLEFLTGLLPTATGFLVPIVYFIATRAADRAKRPLIGWRLAAAALIAFALGAAVTVAAKQALALGLTDPQALTAASLALHRPRPLPLSDLMVFAAGASVVFGWVLVFPNHTFIHAGFMVRIMIMPISLGWAALAWQLSARGEAAREDADPAARFGTVW